MSGPAFELVPLDRESSASGDWELEPVDGNRPSALRSVLLNNPATAIGETAVNLASQAVALPVAGLAGIGAAVGKALGFSDADPAEVVHEVGGALTYEPRGELGKAATNAVMYPFEKLAEAGRYVGDKVLDRSGSPMLATVADTAINAIPMAVAPVWKAGKAGKAAAARALLDHHSNPSPEMLTRLLRMPEEEAASHFNEWKIKQEGTKVGVNDAGVASEGNLRRVETDQGSLPESAEQGLGELRGAGTDDLSSVARLSDVSEGRGAEAGAQPITLVGPDRLEWELRTRERGLDDASAPDLASEVLSQDQLWKRDPDHRGSWAVDRLPDDDVPSKAALAEAEHRTGDGIGKAPVSPRLEVHDAQRSNIERPGVGAGVGDRSSGVARANQEWHPAAADAGIAQAAEAKQASLARAEKVLSQNGSIAGFIDHYNRHVEDGKTIEAFSRNADGGYTLRVSDGAKSNTVTLPAEKMAVALDILRDPAKVTELEARNQGDVVLGRRLRDMDDLTLRRWNGMVSLAPEALAKVAREIKRRNTENEAGGEVRTEAPTEAGTYPTGHVDRPRIAGKAVTELDDAALARMKASPVLSDEARAKVVSEIDRRAGRAEEAPRPDISANIDGRATAARQASAPTVAGDTQSMAAGVQNGTWNPGANYSPFIDQVRSPISKAASVADLPAPLRREHIVKGFADSIGASVYEGRVKGKNRLGFFRPKVEEVRIKRANDIEVVAHELAHLIDHRVPEIANAWRSNKALREELQSVSYDQKSVSEGFAEGVRLWMTQPETLEARAPKVHAWLDEFANTHRYGPALRKAQADMTAWFGQDVLNRARSKIGTEKPLTEFFDRFWDKFRQSTVDDLHGVYRMERDLTGNIGPNGPYESARLSRASASIADGAVRFGHPVKLPDGSFKFAGKGLEEILKPVSESLDDALLYFVGKSAGELMTQGREHLFTRGEIDAMLRLRTPERERAFAEYQAWNRGILDFAEAQGVINPESRRLWQRTQYLPFHRVNQPGGLKGKPGSWQGIQQLTGGTTNIKDVLGNMLGNAAMLIDKAVKNEARLNIADLSQKEGGGRFMVKIDTEARPVKIGGDQVLTAMLKRYGIAVDGDAPAFFEFMIHGQPPAGGNVVAVLKQGKPIWFEVGDPILYRALQAIDRPLQNQVVKWLGLPKRIGQATITATPDFWMANIARDTLMGSVMSRAGFRPVLDSLQGMRLRLTSDPVYRDYLANGGGLSSIFLDEHHLRTKLDKFYRSQGIDYRTVIDAPDKLLTFVEALGDAFEMSTRLGEYRRAVARGEHPRHAAYLGRDVSTDFAMKGDSKALGFLYDTVMFLRPALVSWDRLYRGIAHDPNKGAIAAKAGMMATVSAALYLLNRNDPRYADLPDWDRDANWHFFVGEQHFRWPKIWEVGALSSAAERTVEKIMVEDPEGLGKDFARILGATFNLNLMPQIIAPLYEQATNRNSFTKAPIETPGMENVQPFLRAKPGTSETMKALGMATRNLPEAVQVNPARAEALLRGYFNTYALYGLMLTDKAMFGDQLPEKRTDELPVVRRFYSNEPARHTKYETEFYELLTEAKRLRGTMRELDEMGYRNYADAKEQSPLAGEAKPLEHAAKQLGTINKDMEQIRRNADLGPAEKRARLDQLTRERNALLKDAVIESKAAQKKAGVP